MEKEYQADWPTWHKSLAKIPLHVYIPLFNVLFLIMI